MFKRFAGTFRSSSRKTPCRPTKDARLTFQSLEDRRLLAVITVTSAIDSVFPGSGVTLREAILAANTDTSVDGSVAGNGADTIDFDASLSGQTILLFAELEITEALTIDATALANTVTIDANNASRIINITATTGDFTIAGLTLTGGRTTGDNTVGTDNTFSGGAVRSVTTGNLFIDQSTIDGNSTAGVHAGGGGIFSYGPVTVAGSTVSGNRAEGDKASGGGIFSFRSLLLSNSTVNGNSTTGNLAYGGGIIGSNGVTLNNSTVSGNSTAGANAAGGGILARGDVTLTNSTLSGNSTTGSFADGGGLSVNHPTSVTLTNSTVSGNFTTGSQAYGGGIQAARAAVVLTSSTVTDNHTMHANSVGGGIYVKYSEGTLNVDHSIVSGNSSGSGTSPDFRPGGGTFTANFSLLGTLVIPGVGSNDNIFTNNLLLGPLANNGGPTQTHPLLAGSPAIDAGDPGFDVSAIANDQRGSLFTREFGPRVDIGAYEQQSVPGLNLTVDTNADEINGDYSAGDLSLREAVGLANGSLGADTILFAESLSAENIELGGTEIVITEALTIDATALAFNPVIDANDSSRIFNISATTGDFMIAGLTLLSGRTTGDNAHGTDRTFSGGAIRSISTGSLLIEQSLIARNSTLGAYAGGGGIFSRGLLTLTGSTVSGSRTAGENAGGGGIFAYGSLLLTDSTVTSNRTTDSNGGSGGGILSVTGGTITLINSTVSGNSTAGQFAGGGGIFAYSSITLTNSTVSGNSTTGNIAGGGGISSSNDVTLTNSTVSGNSTAGNNARGGGIRSSGDITLTSSTVSGNSTTGSFSHGGGLVPGYNDTVTLTNSTVSGNSTTGLQSYGGGIHAYVGDVTLTSSTVTDNHTMHANSDGGGIFVKNSGGTIALDDTIVAGNSAGGGTSPDLRPGSSAFTANFSLLGTMVFPGAGSSGNIFSNNPLLGPLANYGGPTATHALLAGSPAIDAGDPGYDVSAIANDQRGALFTRKFGPSVDIGAYEQQSVPGLNLTVDTNYDGIDGDYSPGGLSLREAVTLANGSVGAETITFAASLSGARISLRGAAEIVITEALTVDATALPQQVTIYGSLISRIFRISAGTGDYKFAGLTLTHGSALGVGGAIASSTNGILTIEQSNITASRTTGNASGGGGIRSAGVLRLNNSTVSGNSTVGTFAEGGGILSSGTVTLTNTTISGNSTAGSFARGGGIRSSGAVTLNSSTVTANEATHPSSGGGGIWSSSTDTTLINHSIVSGNSAGGGISDDIRPGTGTFTANFSLLGTLVFPSSGSGNIFNNDPQLGPLADNGGPTETHALLVGSPAIDAGNNPLAVDPDGLPLTVDQRGFTRVIDGDNDGTATVDIGAFEFVEFLLGDVNQDGAVDFLDISPFIGVLSSGGFQAEADINLDGVVDFLDISPFIGLLSAPTSNATSAQLSAAPAESSPQISDGFRVELVAAPSSPPLPPTDVARTQLSAEPSLLAFVGGSQVQSWDDSHNFRNDIPVRSRQSAALQLSHRKTDSLAQQESPYDSDSGASSIFDASAEPTIATNSADLFGNQPELLEGLAVSQLDKAFEELLI